MDNLDTLAAEQYCYLTTQGRKSGKEHTVDLWFALDKERFALYILSGGGEKADWVRNMMVDPYAKVRVGSTKFIGNGRQVTEPDEDLQARKLVVSKYYGRAYNPEGGWEAQSLPVAIDLLGEQS